MIARLRRQLTALVLAVLLGFGVLAVGSGSATAAPAPAPLPVGPTQVLNDPHSAATALVRDNDGARFHIRRGDYVLHETDAQFFVDFYVARGTTVTIYATDDHGRVLPGVLQRETKRGWHTTNARVDDADLVLVRIKRAKSHHRATTHRATTHRAARAHTAH